jgi:uncharacterized membrane protein YhhN
MKKLIMPILLILVGVTSGVLFLLLKDDIPLYLRIILKATPTVMMCLWMIIKIIDETNWPIFVGLILSMICDIFMALSGSMFLVGGILSNMLALIFYTLYYYRSDKKLDLVRIVPILVVMGVFYFVLFDYLGNYKIPVMVYCIIYILFLWRAAARLDDTTISKNSKYICFMGSLLLIVSDSLLSFLLFKVLPDKDKYHYVVMLLWWSGLFMLMITAEKKKNINTEIKTIRGSMK